jgi:uncharacterized protein YejL (UPF0352 family)
MAVQMLQGFLRLLLCGIVLHFCMAVVCAQSAPDTPPAASPTIKSESENLAVLRAQLETMRAYDQRLLATVYYALAGIGSAVLLVVRLGWYTNFRLYRRDVEDLKGSIKSQISALARDLEPKLRQVASEAGQQAVQSSLRSLKELQYEQTKAEAEKWERDGIDANALITYARAIDFALDISPDFQIPHILDEMVRILKKKKAILTALVIGRVNAQLVKIPAEYTQAVDAVRNLIRTQTSAATES